MAPPFVFIGISFFRIREVETEAKAGALPVSVTAGIGNREKEADLTERKGSDMTKTKKYDFDKMDSFLRMLKVMMGKEAWKSDAYRRLCRQFKVSDSNTKKALKKLEWIRENGRGFQNWGWTGPISIRDQDTTLFIMSLEEVNRNRNIVRNFHREKPSIENSLKFASMNVDKFRNGGGAVQKPRGFGNDRGGRPVQQELSLKSQMAESLERIEAKIDLVLTHLGFECHGMQIDVEKLKEFEKIANKLGIS